MKFFYSHGFHSSKKSITYQRICSGLDIMPLEITYDNGGDFRINLQNMKEQLLSQLNENESFSFIGNSLGAFYLWQLILNAESLGIPLPHTLIIFNPVFEPLGQLKKYIDKPQLNHTSKLPFTLSFSHWESYAYALRLPMPDAIRTVVCLCEGDEIIDMGVSRAYWRHYAQIIHLQGGHIIDNFEPLYPKLLDFLS